MSSAARTLAAIPPAVNAWSAEYIDAQYEAYRRDPASIPADLASFFAGFDLASARVPGSTTSAASPLGSKVEELLVAYREFGHLAAKTDPLGRVPSEPAVLSHARYGIADSELDSVVSTDVMPGGRAASVREIIAHLKQTYCGPIGVEFMHIPDERERAWFLKRFEQGPVVPAFSAEDRALILEHLTGAEVFDKFLGKRYQSKKRFSLEGGEALIPLLKWLTQRAGELGCEEIVMGMAHRGRLSVLRNYLGKNLVKFFTEFEDKWQNPETELGGDVKYHRGYSGDQAPFTSRPAGRTVHLSMLNNPSHLESVNPIVMGRTRAKQDRIDDAERRKIVSLLIHGDAAVAGQGIVAECLAMSRLDGYHVGGTIHVVINNQVGFTTDARDARSSLYCTDIGKMINTPVLHVNGDEPEAVVAAAMMCVEYRADFGRDIFVDLICYRLHGHNEQDEPTYTQPTLYAQIKKHPGPAQIYRDRLIAAGVVSAARAEAMMQQQQDELDAAQKQAQLAPVNPVPPPGEGGWKGFTGRYDFDSPATAISKDELSQIARALSRTPEGFNLNGKLKGLLEKRANLANLDSMVAHADGEILAIGSLLLQGTPVRLSGQDCRRGTFTQRHAVLRDEKTDERYVPLNNLRAGQTAMLSVFDSPLSEFGVMGFDYGYSRGSPRTLVMWEAQFGDFVNGAQVMIDQYLVASEAKWDRWGGLVLLLPHGYEGQGPEHSSARLERFLQLCAQENMEVVYPSSGAQMFHLLRRQALRNFRKPLIVMSPKKYLRSDTFEALKVPTSTSRELIEGEFRHLIDDAAFEGAKAKGVRRVVYCTGKIYHELVARRNATGVSDIALVRIEQLYPLHARMLKQIDARYPSAAERVWVQEEPRNQGAFLYIADALREAAGISVRYIGRPASASPATGSEYAHFKQQDRLLSEAIAPLPTGGGSNGSHDVKPALESGKPAIAKAAAATGKPQSSKRRG